MILFVLICSSLPQLLYCTSLAMLPRSHKQGHVLNNVPLMLSAVFHSRIPSLVPHVVTQVWPGPAYCFWLDE